MAGDKALPANELDDLARGLHAAKLSTDDRRADADDDAETEPKASKSTPEGRRAPPQTTIDGRRVMLVAAKSQVKQVAGSIARTTREDADGEPPVVSAVGALSVNQAVKAIAIARDFLASGGLDLAVEVRRQPNNDVKDVLVMALSKHPVGALLGDENTPLEGVEYQDMRSSNTSTPGPLAGAIAKNVREGKRPRITAIGARPVFRAVCAIAIARKYLKKDGFDIDMVPKFTQVKFQNGADANAMMLIVLPRKV